MIVGALMLTSKAKRPSHLLWQRFGLDSEHTLAKAAAAIPGANEEIPECSRENEEVLSRRARSLTILHLIEQQPSQRICVYSLASLASLPANARIIW